MDVYGGIVMEIGGLVCLALEIPKFCNYVVISNYYT